MAMFAGKILLPAPAWTTYNPQVTKYNKIVPVHNLTIQAKLAGHTAIPIQTSENNKWKLTAEDVEAAVNDGKGPWLLVLTNPGNPSGCVYTRVELESLAQVCRKYEIIVLRQV